MLLSYQEYPRFSDKIHEEDLQYMLKNTYTNTSFFLQALTKDSTTYTFWGDMEKDLYFISDNLRDTFGYARNRVEHFPALWEKHIYNPTSRRRYSSELQDGIEKKREEYDLRYQVQDKTGHIFWVHFYGRMEWNSDQTEPIFFCGKIARQDESFLIDPVSAFPGEVVFVRQLDLVKQEGIPTLCVGFCLNGISQINTVQGRTYGNQLIHNIAADLTAEFDGEVSFFRLDGMRFVALVNPETNRDCGLLVEQIRSIINDNYRKMGMVIQKTCSFAALRFPRQGLTSIDFQENMIALIRMARQDNLRPYLDENDESVLRLQRLTNMELLLNRNVLDGMTDFRAVIQPVVSTKTGEIIGGETLMRWKYDEEDVSPAVFIPMLEKDTLIYFAGRWIFQQAVQACCKIVQYIPDFYLNVNVSLQQLHDQDFLKFIPETMEQYGLDGRHIVVEMTESCLDSEPEKVQELFAVCEKAGIRIALDDFGTGYSSMRVLLKYPLSVVKIDRSLLLEMTESEEKLNFISSIVYACHKFGKKVCIEGVENKKQQELAAEAGCDMIQGFYHYHPMELEEVFRLVQQ